jgi:hypothetical protein
MHTAQGKNPLIGRDLEGREVILGPVAPDKLSVEDSFTGEHLQLHHAQRENHPAKPSQPPGL